MAGSREREPACLPYHTHARRAGSHSNRNRYTKQQQQHQHQSRPCLSIKNTRLCTEYNSRYKIKEFFLSFWSLEAAKDLFARTLFPVFAELLLCVRLCVAKAAVRNSWRPSAAQSDRWRNLALSAASSACAEAQRAAIQFNPIQCSTNTYYFFFLLSADNQKLCNNNNNNNNNRNKPTKETDEAN